MSLLKQVLPVMGPRNSSRVFILVDYMNMHNSRHVEGDSLATVVALVPFSFTFSLIAAGFKEKGSKNSGKSG